MKKTSNTSDQTMKTPRWIKILLFLSLAVNLAIAGVVAGALVRFGPSSDARPPKIYEMAGPVTRALDAEDRRDIGRKIMREQRAALPSRKQLSQEYQILLGALRADSFDADLVSGILERQRIVLEKRAALGHQLLVEHLNDMSVEDRIAYADRLETAIKERGQGRGGPRGDGGKSPKDRMRSDGKPQRP